MTTTPRDHGGSIDDAATRWGGRRDDWLDLSTGINPLPYPVPPLDAQHWSALPDRAATRALEHAARRFWHIPDEAAILAAPGASALIARIPALAPVGRVHIPGPTYNEHAAAFTANGWAVEATTCATDLSARVLVHPNNPDGRVWGHAELGAPGLLVLDESFADTLPDQSLIQETARPRVILLKSFGKFWGLAGLRLGFAIGDRRMIDRLADMLGPWPVSGPALTIGRRALEDEDWAEATRARLMAGTARLDAMMARAGADQVGGTTLFRLYRTADAGIWQDHLARHRIWSRVFPYNRHWLRLGLPGRAADWARLKAALDAFSR